MQRQMGPPVNMVVEARDDLKTQEEAKKQQPGPHAESFQHQGCS